jgi:hypothetical protein
VPILGISQIKNWKTVFLLSIIVPVSLLATFKITGIIKEPMAITETVTLEAVGKQIVIEEPHKNEYHIFDINAPPFTNDEALFNLKTQVQFWWSRMKISSSHCILDMYMNASVNSGFIQSFFAVFNSSIGSSLSWPEPEFDFQNLSLTQKADGRGSAFVELAGINWPAEVSLHAEFVWGVLDDSENATNTLNAEFQLTYYNGTTFKKVVQPFSITYVTSTALGLQYLGIRTVLIGVHSYEVTGVKVWIDDVEYSSPVDVVLPAKTRTIRAEPVIYVNSTSYSFDGWWPIGGLANPTTIGPWSEKELTAAYEPHP